jgi:hypothetical protein
MTRPPPLLLLQCRTAVKPHGARTAPRLAPTHIPCRIPPRMPLPPLVDHTLPVVEVRTTPHEGLWRATGGHATTCIMGMVITPRYMPHHAGRHRPPGPSSPTGWAHLSGLLWPFGLEHTAGCWCAGPWLWAKFSSSAQEILFFSEFRYLFIYSRNSIKFLKFI